MQSSSELPCKRRRLEKVLLVYGSKPPIMNYLAAAFNKRGISVEMVCTDEIHWVDRYLIRVINKILHNLRILSKRSSLFSQHRLAHKNFRSNNLLTACRLFLPDLVLIIRGITIREDVLVHIRQKARLFGWWTIGEERMAEAFSEMHLFDWYFFMNSACISAGAQKGLSHISFLQHSVGPELFRPLEGAQKRIDICFVGNWSAKRQAFIESLCTITDKITVIGGKWRRKNLLNAKVRGCIKGDYIDGTDLVRLYNESKIVLNITDWGFGEGAKRSGVNMRILEVPACGAFLLTDGSRDLSTLITPGKHAAVYEDMADCVKQVQYYLHNDAERESIAGAGCLHVRSNYTYDLVINPIIDKYMELCVKEA